MKKAFKILAILAGVFVVLIIVVVLIASEFGKRAQKFQNKALQSEAKILLAGVYIQQKSFFADFNSYTSAVYGADKSFGDIKVSRYKFGFAKPVPLENEINLLVTKAGTPVDITAINSDKLNLVPSYENSVQLEFEKLAEKYGCFVEKEKFKACAIGYLGLEDKLDVWTIDQDKNVVNVENGAGE